MLVHKGYKGPVVLQESEETQDRMVKRVLKVTQEILANKGTQVHLETVVILERGGLLETTDHP